MSSPEPTAALEVLDEMQRGLRVEFAWSGDRFRHVISVAQGAERLPLLSTIEGDVGALFPPSPCYTELHRQEQTLFLTGATSACHWSLSVEAAQALFQGLPKCSLTFDVACRLRSAPALLGSEYRLEEADGIKVQRNTRGELSFVQSPSEAEFVLLSGELASSRAGSRFILSDSRILGVTPSEELPEKAPATVRWRYAFRVV